MTSYFSHFITAFCDKSFSSCCSFIDVAFVKFSVVIYFLEIMVFKVNFEVCCYLSNVVHNHS